MAGETSNQAKNRKEAVRLTQHLEGTARKIQIESEQLSVMQKNNQLSNWSHQHKLHTIAMHINEQLQPTLHASFPGSDTFPDSHEHTEAGNTPNAPVIRTSFKLT